MKLTFGKNEKLKSKKAIEALFSEGQSYVSHPIRIVYHVKTQEKFNVQVGVSVAKKRFKHAVDRNLLKRRIREAYRLNKSLITSEEPLGVDVLFIYTSSSIKDFDKINQAMKEVLEKLNHKLTKKEQSS